MYSKAFYGTVLLNVALQIAGARFAILHRLPYEFAGLGDPDNMVGDAILNGTALSAPLLALVGIIFFLLFSLRMDRLGSFAGLGITMLGFLFSLSGLAEPLLWRTILGGGLTLLDWEILGLGLGTIIAALAMLATGARETRRAFKMQLGS